MSLAILGIGTATPSRSISQEEAAILAKHFCCRNPEEEKFLETLYERTSVRRRSSVLLEAGGGERAQPFFSSMVEGEWGRGPTTEERMDRYAREAGPLACEAARRALRDAKAKPVEISHLITVSCTGFRAPGTDILLIKALGLSPSVARSHVGFMGCHGALNGVRIAKGFAEAEPRSLILLCAVELCSLHFFCGWEPEKVVANGLFADGAAALVGSKATLTTRHRWKVKSSGSFLFPESEEAMSWRIGNYGFEMTLSPEVPERIARHLRLWIEKWLGQNRLKLSQIRSWAVHPGGPKILEAAALSLGLSQERVVPSREILAEYGNMSSPTVLFVIQRLRSQNSPRPCVVLGFGPGLAVEAALIL